MKKRARTPKFSLVIASMCVLLGACGESSYDIYMRGLKQSEEANKVHCQMLWDEASSAMVINSSKIIECKKANERALETIKQAQAAGFTGKDVDRTIAGIEEKLQKLDSRLKVVSYMERQMELEG
jgi:hypothetical protein